MGEQHVSTVQEGQAAQQFTKELLRDLRALEYMLEHGMIETGVRRMGAEQELVLIDQTSWQPAPVNVEVLEQTEDPHLTTELARFNMEINLDPLLFEDDCFRRLEDNINAHLKHVETLARDVHAAVVLVGILPTVRLSHLSLDNMTPRERYYALNERLTRMRGRPYELQIQGPDELSLRHDTVMLEACNTSFQVHMQVSPDEFAPFYNIAQVLAAPVLAAASNSPLLFGKRLWRETRIAVFQQSIDTRNGSLYLRETSPRVTFGTQWVKASVLDVFREDVARFPAIISAEEHEDPFAQLEQEKAPHLRALQVHNSTVYRWNRACYGVTDGHPHLRIENRVLPAGPTPADEVANAAFWLGLMHGMAGAHDDVTQVMAFDDAKMNFFNAARLGLNAQFHWLKRRIVPARQLILRELLPLARDGLQAAGIDARDIERYLGIIEERVLSRRTGAQWQVESIEQMMEEDGHPIRQLDALVAAMVRRQHAGAPVHTWGVATQEEAEGGDVESMRVEACMSTDLFTVHEDEQIDFVAAVMDWRAVRHIPVEDSQQQLVGVISLRALLKLFVQDPERDPVTPVPARAVMTAEPITVTPDTPIWDAVHLMKEHKIGSLPVVQEGRLVGIVTERDVVGVAARLMDRFRLSTHATKNQRLDQI